LEFVLTPQKFASPWEKRTAAQGYRPKISHTHFYSNHPFYGRVGGGDFETSPLSHSALRMGLLVDDELEKMWQEVVAA